jgi:hypothetical protein
MVFSPFERHKLSTLPAKVSNRVIIASNVRASTLIISIWHIVLSFYSRCVVQKWSGWWKVEFSYILFHRTPLFDTLFAATPANIDHHFRLGITLFSHGYLWPGVA